MKKIPLLNSGRFRHEATTEVSSEFMDGISIIHGGGGTHLCCPSYNLAFFEDQPVIMLYKRKSCSSVS